jgi:hypothetical protein
MFLFSHAQPIASNDSRRKRLTGADQLARHADKKPPDKD